VRNLHEGEVIILNSEDSEPHVLRAGLDEIPHSPDLVNICVMRSYAHPQGVFIYRIEYGGKALVLATDVEGYIGGDQRLIRFARGAHLLIHDAQYTDAEYKNPNAPRQGWGHSTWQMAVEVAQAARAERLALFHHDPVHTDDMLARAEREAQVVFPGAIMACERLTIEL
jgi:ribonuclease BN (tRNA processing enzyme)